MGVIAKTIAARRAGLLTSEQLVDRLAAAVIAPPADPPAPTDPAAVYEAAEASYGPPGEDTWAEILDAVDQGHISDEEYAALSDRIEGGA